ncbi:MAG: J domain-containing protein [Deltaproteobacteria bacterium]|nr:J domain-containing protein [Deltaproteobacteria bacterium]
MLIKSKLFAENENRCLSCGTTENIKNRRYCSVKCRQHLRQKLNMKSGLLEALNTRYATFYFSDSMIFLDIVPFGVKEIFRYTGKRTAENNPAKDFNIMTNNMGDAWWAESKRTNKNYRASQYVLKMATRCIISEWSQRPRLIRIPTIKMESLNYLEINKADLHSHELSKIIKNAYRHQVKIHHPDAGGQAVTFRKIHDAYKELLRWADNPVFIHRRGFPDKWYYNGENKKWVQPTPIRD